MPHKGKSRGLFQGAIGRDVQKDFEKRRELKKKELEKREKPKVDREKKRRR